MITSLIHTNSIHEIFHKVKVPGDGHCFLYSIVKSLSCQLNREIDLTFLKHMIVIEVCVHIHRYINYFNDNCEFSIKQLLFRYIFEKQYDTDFGDIVPYCVANVLNVGLIVLNDFSNLSNLRSVVVPSTSNTSEWVVISRERDHYDALCYDGKDCKCKCEVDCYNNLVDSLDIEKRFRVIENNIENDSCNDHIEDAQSASFESEKEIQKHNCP